MPLMRSYYQNAWLQRPWLVLLALAAAPVFPAAAQGGTGTHVELIPLPVAGTSDTTTTLPVAVSQVDSGGSFVVEVWAQTDDPQGLSSVSTTIQFTQSVAMVSGVTHTTLFSQLTGSDVDNVAGTIVGLTGSHLSTCADQVGVTPMWGRVAILDMQAIGSGTLVVASADTGLLAFGTAICGVGDLLPSQVTYGSAALTVAGAPIPTVSEWGLVVLTLMLMSAGTVAILRRAPCA